MGGGSGPTRWHQRTAFHTGAVALAGLQVICSPNGPLVFFFFTTRFRFFYLPAQHCCRCGRSNTVPLKITTCPVPAVADTESVMTQWWHETHKFKQMHYASRSQLCADHPGQWSVLHLKLSLFSKINLAQPIWLRVMREEEIKLIFLI